MAASAVGLVLLAVRGGGSTLCLGAALALLAGGVALAAHRGDASPVAVAACAGALVAVAECSGLASRARSFELVERRALRRAWRGVALSSIAAVGLAAVVLAASSLPVTGGLPLALCGAAAIAGLAAVLRACLRTR